jgi:hypothetical protein
MLDSVPIMPPRIRVRAAEAIAYDPRHSTIFELSEDGMMLLRAIDGERTVLDVMRAVAGDQQLLPEFVESCSQFFEICASKGLITWRE